MIFLELVLQNFGPYSGRHTLTLQPEADRPIVLIGGLNGGGKTTLMDAIRLASIWSTRPNRPSPQFSLCRFPQAVC
jgi:DNA sulfur modification protein DndD